MKKSLIILILLALSFAGNAQERAVVEYRSYEFDVQNDLLQTIVKSSSFQWFHEMDLYIDGKYEQTLRIGNRIDMLLNFCFFVPIGSSWRLVPGKTEAIKDGYQMVLNIYYRNSGLAQAPGRELLTVSIR